MTGVRRWWLCRAATAQPQLADAAAVAVSMLGHWEQSLAEIGFLDPTAAVDAAFESSSLTEQI
jgi:hypothetical protein